MNRWTAAVAPLLFTVPALAQQHIAGGSAQLTQAGPVSRGAVAFLYRATEHGVPDNVRVVDIELHKADLAGSATPDCSVEVWLKDVPVTEDTWIDGSTQTLAAAQQGATRVFQGTGLALPQAMGFVRFQQTQRGLSFDHVSGNIAVLVVTDCATPRPLMWKGDVLAGRGRGVRLSAAATGATVLSASKPFSIHRPQARFTWLVPGRKLQVRVGTTLIPNNGRFAPAMNSWAAGTAVPQHYQLWNLGLTPIALGAVAFSALSNIAVAVSGAAPTVIMPGDFVPLDLTVTPTAAGAAAFDITLPTDDPQANQMRWGFTGQVKAARAAQLDRRRVLADGTSAALTDNQTVELGDVVVGGEVFIEEDLSNYGSDEEPGVTVTATPGANVEAVVEQAPTTAPVQTEGRTRIRMKPTKVQPGMTVTVTITTASGRLSTVVYRANGVGAEIVLQRLVELPSGTTDQLEVPLPAGMKVPVEYTILNVGYGWLQVSGITASDEMGGTAVITSPTVFSLNTFEAAPLIVDVTSTAGDSIKFNLRVANNDPDEAVYLIAVERAGAVPKLTLLAGDVALANNASLYLAELDDEFSTHPYTRTMKIRNDGDAPLTVMSVTAKPKSQSMSNSESGCTGRLVPEAPAGETIAPGQTGAPFEAEVDGSQAGQASDCALVITVRSDDRKADPFTATLTVPPAAFISTCGVNCSTDPSALAVVLAALVFWRRRQRLGRTTRARWAAPATTATRPGA